MFVGQLCNSGYDTMFTQEKVEFTKYSKCVMSGLCDPQSRLWRVNLKEDAKPACKSEFNHAHENSNQKELINYLHDVYFSPVKSTWIKAIMNGHFTSWTGVTEQSVPKHVSKSTKTAK
jgi:hypothetical protein